MKALVVLLLPLLACFACIMLPIVGIVLAVWLIIRANRKPNNGDTAQGSR